MYIYNNIRIYICQVLQGITFTPLGGKNKLEKNSPDRAVFLKDYTKYSKIVLVISSMSEVLNGP